MDLLQREGRYPLPPQAPKTLGVEFSGVVEKLSPEVEGFKEDNEVFGLAYGGTYTLDRISCSLDVNGTMGHHRCLCRVHLCLSKNVYSQACRTHI